MDIDCLTNGVYNTSSFTIAESANLILSTHASSASNTGAIYNSHGTCIVRGSVTINKIFSFGIYDGTITVSNTAIINISPGNVGIQTSGSFIVEKGAEINIAGSGNDGIIVTGTSSIAGILNISGTYNRGIRGAITVAEDGEINLMVNAGYAIYADRNMTINGKLLATLYDSSSSVSYWIYISGSSIVLTVNGAIIITGEADTDIGGSGYIEGSGTIIINDKYYLK